MAKRITFTSLLITLLLLLSHCSDADTAQTLQAINDATKNAGGPSESTNEIDEDVLEVTSVITQDDDSKLQDEEEPTDNSQADEPENTDEQNLALNEEPAQSASTSEEANNSSEIVVSDNLNSSLTGDNNTNADDTADETTEPEGSASDSPDNDEDQLGSEVNQETIAGAIAGDTSDNEPGSTPGAGEQGSDNDGSDNGEQGTNSGNSESELVYNNPNVDGSQSPSQGNPDDDELISSDDDNDLLADVDEENNDSSNEIVHGNIIPTDDKDDLTELLTDAGAVNIEVVDGRGTASLSLVNDSALTLPVQPEDQNQANSIIFNFRAETEGHLVSAGSSVGSFPSADITLEHSGLNIRLSDVQGNEIVLQDVKGNQATLIDGSWHEVALSYDATGDKKVRVYLDQALVATSSETLEELPVIETVQIGQTTGDRIVLAEIQTELGTNTAHIDINKLDSTSFNVRVEEDMSADVWHVQESIGFLAAKPGIYNIQGKKVEIGTLKANHEWTATQFQHNFTQPPIVVANIYTEVGTHNAHIDLKDITANGLVARVEEDMSSDGPHLVETIGYIAMEPGVYRVDGKVVMVAGSLETNHEWASTEFASSFDSTPIVISNIATEFGTDNAMVDLNNVSAAGFTARVEEDMSADGPHVSESIHYLAIAPSNANLLPGYIEAGTLITDHNWASKTLTNAANQSIQGQLEGLEINAESIEEVCDDQVMCAAASTIPEDKDNLIVNGSFEVPRRNHGSWGVYNQIDGWQTSSGSGIEIQNHAAGNPFQGAQLVELASHNQSTVYQLVETIPNSMYRLQVAFSPRPSEKDNRIEIRWNGNPVAILDGDGEFINGTQWKSYTFNVIATGDESRLEFADISQGRVSYGGYIDDISLVYVSEVTDAVAAAACTTRTVSLDPSMGRWFEEEGNFPGEKLTKAKRVEIRNLIKQNHDQIKAIRQEIRDNRGDGKGGERLVEIDELRADNKLLRSNLQAGRPKSGVWTAWNNEPLHVKVTGNCQPGWFKLKVVASNHGDLPQSYGHFIIKATLDDGRTEHIFVPASTTGYFGGRSKPMYLPEGASNIQLIWNNDAAKKGVYDANINIRNVKLIPSNPPKPVRLLAKNARQICDSQGKWFSSSRSMITYWAKQRLDYCFQGLPAGKYHVSVLAKNTNDNPEFSLPDNYESFNLTATMVGTTNSVSVDVPANDDAYKRGTSDGVIEHDGGDLKLRVVWNNDKWIEDKKQDANIEIRNIRLKPVQ